MEDAQDVESSGIVASRGGSVSVNGVKLTCPHGAVKDPVTVKLKLDEPHKYCGLLIHRGLENVVIFDGHIINCQPNGQIFEKNVMLTISFDKMKRKSPDALLVLHGTPTTEGRIFWEDITCSSKFDLVKKELEVQLTRFSLIALLRRLIWVPAKEILTRLNLISFKYMLSVLYKNNRQHSLVDELAVVFMSLESYQEPLYREHGHSALTQLKRNGFEELNSNIIQDRNYICNNESLIVSVQLEEDYKLANNQQKCITLVVDASVWWSTGHAIKLPLQGSGAGTKIICGRIAVQGQCGHVREDHFCQMGEFCFLNFGLNY